MEPRAAMRPLSTAREESYRTSLSGLEVTIVASVRRIDMVVGFYLNEGRVGTEELAVGMESTG